MPQSSWCALWGRQGTTDLDSQSLRVRGLIKFAGLTSQTIKIHPARLVEGLIMGIWHELFFHMVSSYGMKHLRDKGSITCHDRLFQQSVIPPIKNLCLISNLSLFGFSFQKVALLIHLSAWLKSAAGSCVFSPWRCLYINQVDFQSSCDKLARLSTSDLSLEDITSNFKTIWSPFVLYWPHKNAKSHLYAAL